MLQKHMHTQASRHGLRAAGQRQANRNARCTDQRMKQRAFGGTAALACALEGLRVAGTWTRTWIDGQDKSKRTKQRRRYKHTLP
eukprot:15476616-Alexandrium_andersonii.AAC.1